MPLMPRVGVILAAGRGKRMGLLGQDYPKVLLPVANQPLIEHHLKLLKSLGARKVFVVVGHRATDVARAYGDGHHLGLTIHYIDQGAPRGSAHALGLLRPHVDGPFVVLLGDYFFSTSEPERLLQRMETGSAAILAKREPDARLVREACELRVVEDGQVVTIVEKPTFPIGDLKGCGFYAFGLDIFDAIARTPRTALRDEYELTVALELYLSSGGRLYAEELPIRWDSNFTTPWDVLECNMQWLRFGGLDCLIAEDATVTLDSRLEHVMVGRGAYVGTAAVVKEAVVFGGTCLDGPRAFTRVVATPQRLYSLEPGAPAAP